MKWPAIGFWAVLTEVLVVAFVWTAGMMRATSVKAQTTEARVSALIPQVNTVNTAANNAQSTASSALSLANTVDSRTSGLSIPQGRATGLTACPNPPTQAWGNTVVSFCTQVNTILGTAGIFV
jgi:hypothetical protein